MPGQQAEQLTARVAAGPRDRNPRTHVAADPFRLWKIIHYSAFICNQLPRIGWLSGAGEEPARLGGARLAHAAAGGRGAAGGLRVRGAAGAGPGASCGTTRTAANVPVIIKVAKGTVNCGTALRVENEYAARIRAGQVQGNGGGAPVTVSGWTCQGYPTPEVLSTGNASQCHTGSAAIVAVLAVPTPATTLTAG